MVALNYARDVRIGDKPALAVALGSNFVWPTLPERLFLRGQSMVYDFVGQKYAARLPDDTIDYTTNINDLGIVTRASTATYWGPSGTLLEAAVDEARIQHDPVTGEALGLLIEESRTNTIPNTDLSIAAAGTTLVTQRVSARFGEHSCRIETPDETRPSVLYSTAGSGATGTVRSVAVRAVELDVVLLTVYGFGSTASHSFNLSSGTVDQLNSGGRLVNPTIEDIGDGWFLISAQLGPTASGSYTRLGLRGYKSDGSAIVAGDGFEAALPQSESGGSYTSRIPTIDSPVTRAADEVSIDLSDVFNPDEGTLRITAQVPEGGVVASLGDRRVISDSNEFKEYDLSYIFHSGNTVAQLGEGIFNKVEYFPAIQGETALEYLIRTLYGNGEQGAMYIPEPKVLGQQVLWQDVEGTVPVTADGDPVGYMQDLSGNGNHATQSTSAARPIYRTDGVLHWIEGDGIDDALRGLNFPAFGSGPRAVMAAFEQLSSGTRPAIVVLGNSSRNMAMFACMSEYAIRYEGGNQVFDAAAPLNQVEIAEWESTGATVGDGRVFRNGVELGVSAVSNGGNLIDTEGGLRIFEYPPSVGEQGALRIYGVIVVPYIMTPEQKHAARQYLAAISGGSV